MISFAYVRVSSREQNPERQLEAIRAYCPDIAKDRIFTDKLSGRDFDRPQYQALKTILANMASVSDGNEPIQLIVEELDRLGRNKEQVKAELEWFKANGIIIRILELPTTLMDMSVSENRWVFDMASNILIEVYSAIAQQENEKRRKRQAEGIALAKQKGVYKGRKPVEVDWEAFRAVYTQWKLGRITATAAMNILSMKKSTFYRRVKELEAGKAGREVIK